MKAVVYARVSSKEQEKEGFSVAAQLKLLRDYAAAQGIEVVAEFVDVETAKRAGRAEFGKMTEYLADAGDDHVVLVEKVDRLYRNIKDWVVLDELGTDIHLVKEGVVLSEDSRSSEKFMHGIKVLMAKNYVDNLSEETKKGMTEKAEQGIWPSNAPIGYSNVPGPDGKRIIEPDLERAGLVHWLFETYAEGRHSLTELVRAAREKGLAYRKSGKSLSKGTVHKLLRNRIYTGDFEWNGKVYAGTHEPIVEQATWDRVQDILGSRSRPRPSKRALAFGGLITCGHCGCALVGEVKKGKYVYYHCTGNRGDCGEPYVREEALSEHFASALDRLHFSDEVLEWVRTALLESHADEQRFRDESIADLTAQDRKLAARIDAMYLDKLDGRITEEYFDQKAAAFRSEQRVVRQQIEEHHDADDCYLDQGVRLFELAQRAASLFRAREPKEQRVLLDFLCSNSTWADGKLTVTYRKPFDCIAVAAGSEPVEAGVSGGEDARFEKWLPE